jgi:hypothetical protein
VSGKNPQYPGFLVRFPLMFASVKGRSGFQRGGSAYKKPICEQLEAWCSGTGAEMSPKRFLIAVFVTCWGLGGDSARSYLALGGNGDFGALTSLRRRSTSWEWS